MSRPGTANWILAGLIGVFGAVLFVIAVRSGRGDSALLFVGLPVLLAAALAVSPSRTTHGRVFRFTTVFLLLAAVVLHEGAICVILAAPLVYLVAHGTTALIRWCTRTSGMYAILPVPLLLLVAVEGTTTALRISPDQSVQVVRVVAMPVSGVVSHLAAGPQPTRVRSVPLRLLAVPMPEHVSGGKLKPGDRWTFGYHGTSHGPGGQIVAEVRTAEPDHLSFAFVEDSSITARWLAWQQADVRWRAIDPQHTEVRLTVNYRRRLDPSWYFGPLQDALMHQGMGHLMDTMAMK
ncbi:hypothetical protein HC028_07675 [Planosporangium flavigriseum]|nr:hypothetical protein [Planosporangium flavigriseum]NJC64391.1 hypothetical protein [Planosporangium flavigriseum]